MDIKPPDIRELILGLFGMVGIIYLMGLLAKL